MKSPHIDSLIFDLDGTLWATVNVCTRAWNHALERLSVDLRLTEAMVAGTMGLTSSSVRKALFSAFSEERGTALVNECFLDEMAFLRREGGQLYDGVREGLRTLSKLYPMALVSNCEIPYIEAFAESTALGDCFVELLCHGHTGLPKGNNIRIVADRHKFKNPVYVGDTATDEEASRYAGVSFGFAAYGFGKCRMWDFRFERFSEMVPFFIKKAIRSGSVVVQNVPAEKSKQLMELLHEAYGKLASAKGIVFLASYQDKEMTKQRLAHGECLGAWAGKNLLGAITLYTRGGPIPETLQKNSDVNCEWYKQKEVVVFGQFGVKPEFQRYGLGLMLLEAAENRALELGFKEIALDTAENASDLIRWYSGLGYRMVDKVKWPHDEHQSVVMSKCLE
jgi:phosphoglycolate phosphatase